MFGDVMGSIMIEFGYDSEIMLRGMSWLNYVKLWVSGRRGLSGI